MEKFYLQNKMKTNTSNRVSGGYWYSFIIPALERKKQEVILIYIVSLGSGKPVSHKHTPARTPTQKASMLQERHGINTFGMPHLPLSSTAGRTPGRPWRCIPGVPVLPLRSWKQVDHEFEANFSYIW